MIQTATELLHFIEKTRPLLLEISTTDAAIPPALGKWSPKEIIGHLIDSAANNHQRFVRAQAGITDMAPYRYDQNHWVSVQKYSAEEWTSVVKLWYTYNRHLCHIIRQIPEESGAFELEMGQGQTVTLRFLVEDYVVHLKHHLDSILGN